MSFLKQLPPNPGPALRNDDPILLSVPTAIETSLICAPVISHNAEIEFIELILCARKALAVNLDSSELQRSVVSIFLIYPFRGNFGKSINRFFIRTPIKILSGFSKFSAHPQLGIRFDMHIHLGISLFLIASNMSL